MVMMDMEVFTTISFGTLKLVKHTLHLTTNSLLKIQKQEISKYLPTQQFSFLAWLVHLIINILPLDKDTLTILIKNQVL